MKRALHHRTQTGGRGRSVTRLQVNQLEARLAAGSVFDLFGLSWAGPSLSGPPGEFLSSEVVAADSAADQWHAGTRQSRSPITSVLPALTTPQNPDGSRSSSTAGSPVSSQGSAVVLDPRWGGIKDPLEAAWDRMGTFDTLPRGTSPTGPVAPRLGSLASGGAGNQAGHT